MKKYNLLNSKLFSKILCKECVICGNCFGVKINRDGLIETDCFHTKINTNIFLGWTYRFDHLNKDDIFIKLEFKNTFYRIIGFSEWSRDLVYFIWDIFCGWQKWEYWECPECSNREDG